MTQPDKPLKLAVRCFQHGRTRVPVRLSLRGEASPPGIDAADGEYRVWRYRLVAPSWQQDADEPDRLEEWMRLWGVGLLLMFAVPGTGAAGQALPMETAGLRITGPVFVSVQVRDLVLTSNWYLSTFGLEQVNRIDAEDGRYSILILAGEEIQVELLRVRGATSGTNPALGLFKVGFHVDDIEAAHRWIQGQGGDTDERIFTDEALQARSFAFRDPEGNRLQAFQGCGGPCS